MKKEEHKGRGKEEEGGGREGKGRGGRVKKLGERKFTRKNDYKFRQEGRFLVNFFSTLFYEIKMSLTLVFVVGVFT